jgi:two-component system, chemotaxis family, response regulator Rcp1
MSYGMKNDASGKPHIVLIEDNPSDVYLMSLALEENGVAFELTNFQSGAEALPILCPDAVATDRLPLPDLIVLDLNTPGPDGFEVLARIKSNADLEKVPVAILTSSESPADKRRAALLGATTYIQKPTQLKAFIDEVGRAVKLLLANGKPKARGHGGD